MEDAVWRVQFGGCSSEGAIWQFAVWQFGRVQFGSLEGAVWRVQLGGCSFEGAVWRVQFDSLEGATQVQDRGSFVSEATVPVSVIDVLEADLTPPVPSIVPTSAGMLLQMGLHCVFPQSEPGPTQWESCAEFSLETRPSGFKSGSQEGYVSREGRVFCPMGPADTPVPLTVPASSGAVRRLTLVGAQFHSRRDAVVLQSVGIPESIQERDFFGCGVQPG